MAALRYSPNLTVAQALGKSSRDVSGVFRVRKTACVGCALAGLCTLADVSKVYGMPLEAFVGELQRAANPKNPRVSGVQND
jgi:hypothetical protein